MEEHSSCKFPAGWFSVNIIVYCDFLLYVLSRIQVIWSIALACKGRNTWLCGQELRPHYIPTRYRKTHATIGAWFSAISLPWQTAPCIPTLSLPTSLWCSPQGEMGLGKSQKFNKHLILNHCTEDLLFVTALHSGFFQTSSLFKAIASKSFCTERKEWCGQ